MGRAPCCDKANVKRGPWSPEEDAKLKSYIEKHGTGGNWIALPQKIGLKRCGKSCRLRWLNYLRPNIKHGGFTEDEDNLICSLYISIGSRWSIIAAQLPGRTDNDIKNYWNTRLKKKLLGRQRREMSKKGAQTGSINARFGLNNYPLSPLLLDTCYSNSITTTNSIIPTVEPVFHYDHQSQNLCKNYGFDPLCGSNYHSINISGVAADDFQAFDAVPEGIMYGMPQQLMDGFDSFSAVDMVNSSTVSTESASSMSGLGYFSVLSSHEVCQKRMEQECSVFDQQRLLAYSE